jgi:hypothetical protein
MCKWLNTRRKRSTLQIITLNSCARSRYIPTNSMEEGMAPLSSNIQINMNMPPNVCQ